MTRFLFLAATLGVLAMNAAAILLPLNGVGTDELSELYPTGFTPAGWVFSIWSVIYLGLLLLSGWAAAMPARNAERLARIRVPYLVSCAANAGWLVLWHYQLLLPSVAVMLLLLTSLVLIYSRLRRTPARSWVETLCVDAPFSLYLGWISTASIANFATWRFEVGTYPLGLPMDDWALLSVTFAIALYVGVGVLTKDAIYVGVFAWAASGIAFQTLPTSDPVRLVSALGGAVAGTLAVVLLAARLLEQRSRPSDVRLSAGGTGQ